VKFFTHECIVPAVFSGRQKASQDFAPRPRLLSFSKVGFPQRRSFRKMSKKSSFLGYDWSRTQTALPSSLFQDEDPRPPWSEPYGRNMPPRPFPMPSATFPPLVPLGERRHHVGFFAPEELTLSPASSIFSLQSPLQPLLPDFLFFLDFSELP